MIKEGEPDAHNLPGTPGSNFSCEMLLPGEMQILIHLKIDNATAVSYINKYRGTKSLELNKLTKDLWLWCLEREIPLQASHTLRKIRM